MDITKRSASRRISVWVLIFALILTVLSSTFVISAHAKNGVMGEIGDAAKHATNEAGDAIKDTADKVTDKADDMMDKDDGTVDDSDGMIGNESDESGSHATTDEGRTVGWLGLIIALAIVLVAIILIVILSPRKKKR